MGNFCVYKHTSPSGKVYIGITSQNPIDRWQNGLGYRRNAHFYRAITKYGWDNFRHEIVRANLTKEAACQLEISLIAEYRSTEKQFGYNITAGGEFFKHTDASRQLMSERRKGKGTGPVSEETRARMRAAHAGGAEAVKVLCVETGVVYPSISAARTATGANKMAITRCCRGTPHYNTAGGFHWKFIT